jgi:hypothetical protein
MEPSMNDADTPSACARDLIKQSGRCAIDVEVANGSAIH